MMRKLYFFLLMIISLSALGQNKDEELAAQYFSNNEFEKAAVIYEKLVGQNPSSIYLYENYFQSLLAMKKYDEVEKIVKKQIKRYPAENIYKVDLGYTYARSGNDEKAKDHYEKIIKSIVADQDQVISLANAFERRELFKYSIETYLKGRKLMRNDNQFQFELGELYYLTGDILKMTQEYFDVLLDGDSGLEPVQNRIQEIIGIGNNAEIIKKELLQRVQKHPDRFVYNELYMWVLIQQKDFRGALLQSKAIDKRLKEQGRRVMQLAELCISNGEFDVAVECFQYVISLGQSGAYYLQARSGVLNSRFQKISESTFPSTQEIQLLENEYLAFFNENGRGWEVANSLRQLAHLYMFYAHNLDKAISVLDELVQMPRIQPQFRAKCKLDLGDAYLIKGDVWESALLFAQVDKDFKEDPLGQEAKFRNARLDFYKGEFEWAQAQLDVLKTATSQLISNNAIELSLLIQDNTGLDSTEDALRLYAQANLLLFQNKTAESLNKLDSINKLYPGHSLIDEILYTKAQIMKKKGDYLRAAEFYNQVVTNYSYDILADNALFELAELYEFRLNQREKAQQLYEDLIVKYPGSLFVVEARKRFRNLRGDSMIK